MHSNVVVHIENNWLCRNSMRFLIFPRCLGHVLGVFRRDLNRLPQHENDKNETAPVAHTWALDKDFGREGFGFCNMLWRSRALLQKSSRRYQWYQTTAGYFDLRATLKVVLLHSWIFPELDHESIYCQRSVDRIRKAVDAPCQRNTN